MGIAFEHNAPRFIDGLIDAGSYISLLGCGQRRKEEHPRSNIDKVVDTASQTKGNRLHALLLKRICRPTDRYSGTRK